MTQGMPRLEYGRDICIFLPASSPILPRLVHFPNVFDMLTNLLTVSHRAQFFPWPSSIERARTRCCARIPAGQTRLFHRAQGHYTQRGCRVYDKVPLPFRSMMPYPDGFSEIALFTLQATTQFLVQILSTFQSLHLHLLRRGSTPCPVFCCRSRAPKSLISRTRKSSRTPYSSSPQPKRANQIRRSGLFTSRHCSCCATLA